MNGDKDAMERIADALEEAVALWKSSIRLGAMTARSQAEGRIDEAALMEILDEMERMAK